MNRPLQNVSLFFLSVLAWFACSLRLETLRADSPPAPADGSVVTVAAGTESPAAAKSSLDDPLKFRRILVPAGQIEKWPRGDERLIPMSADEFERRLRDLPSQQNAPRQRADLIEAMYDASLDANGDLVGSGTWIIRHTGKEHSIIDLGSLNLALGKLRWDDAQTARVLLGTNATGQAKLAVDRAGTIAFAWSSRSEKQADSDSRFDLKLAPCASSQLRLKLPNDWTPIVAGGTVVESSESDAGRRRWVIQATGQAELAIQLTKQPSAVEPRPALVFRPKLIYELSPRGLQLTAEWKIDVLERSTRKLQVDLDPSLTLLGVRQGEKSVPWLADADSPANVQRITLTLPDSISGINNPLRLAAAAPLVTDKPWRLPRLHLSQATWQEGTTALRIESPLTLTQFDTFDCRPLKRETDGVANTVEAFALQPLSAAAEIDLVVTQLKGKFQSFSATTIDLLGTEVNGRLEAEITAIEGERFVIEAEISPDWVIDSVTSSPPGLVADWSRERTASHASRLLVRLSKTVNRDRPLRLIVNGQRRRAPLGDTLTLNDLRILTLDDIAAARRLMVLRTNGPYRLEVEPVDELTRLDARRLLPADAALLGDNTRGIIFVADQTADDLRVRLLSETPRFTSNIDVEALLTDRGYSESYAIHCVPESNELDRVLVHFSAVRTEAFSWTIESTEPNSIIARRLTESESAANHLPTTGETWQVDLAQPRGTPFTLHATRVLPKTDTMPVALASTVQAASQRGSVVIRSSAANVPTIRRSRLKSAPTEPVAHDTIQSVLGRFAYDPAEDALAGDDQPLELIRATATERVLPMWVWRWQIDSWYSSANTTDFRARLAIENTGRSDLRLTFAGARQSPLVRLNGELFTSAVFDNLTQELRIELPIGRRFVNIELEWTENDTGLGVVSRKQLRFPTINIPVLTRSWTVWLPREYELSDSAIAWHSAGGFASPSWTQRLFGVLGRPPKSTTFEPWSRRDWSELSSVSAVDPNLRCATDFIQATNAPSVSTSARSRDTWGERLYGSWLEASSLQPGLQTSLLIHVPGLERCGILPAGLVPISNDQASNLADTTQSLPVDASCGALVVLVHPRGLLLTSRQAADVFLPANDDHRSVRLISAGPLADAFETATLEQLLGPVTSIETWLNLPPANRADWDRNESISGNSSFDQSWRAFRFEAPFDGQLTVTVVRPRSIQGFCIAIGFACVLIMWRMSLPPLVKVAVWGGCAIAALLLPVSIAPLGAAGFAGLMLGQLGRWFFPTSSEPSDSDEIAATPSEAATSYAGVLQRSLTILAVVATLSAAVATADPSMNSKLTRAAPIPSAVEMIYDVLVPVDEQQRPTGDLVYLPERFYNALIRRTTATESQGHADWLLLNARYRGSLTRETRSSRRVLDWGAAFEFETFADGVTIKIPFGNDGVRLLPDGATIDGKPLSLNWDAATKRSSFDVAGSGLHRVEIAFRPVAITAGARPNFEFSIPACPVAEAKVTLPIDGETGHIDSRGSVRIDDTDHSLHVSLGGVDRLTYKVDDPEIASAQKPVIEVDDVQWLKIRPGSRTLDARFQTTVRRGRLRQLVLQVDPRLQLLPLPIGSPVTRVPLVRGASEHDRSGQIVLDFTRPITDRAVVDLAFVLTDSVAAEELRWPRLEVLQSQATRRTIAVSVDPWFEFTPQPAASAKPLTPLQFAAAWGRPEAPPTLAYNVSSGDGQLSLSIRAPTVRAATDDTTVYTLGRKEIDFVWASDVVVSSGNRLQFRAKAPTGLEITSVEVRDNAGVRPLRWSRFEKGGLSIFLETPLGGQFRIIARGRLPVDKPGELPLPTMRLDDAELRTSTLLLLRRSSVTASLVERGGHVLLNAQDSENLLDSARQQKWIDQIETEPLSMVAALSGKRPSGRLAIELSKNQPEVNAMQVTTISRGADTWSANVHLDLDVTAGLLDQIRLNVPATWKGPYEIYPPVETRLVEVPGESRLQLILRPKAPLQGDVRFRIRAPIAIAMGRRLRVPDIELSQATRLRKFEVLPTQFDLQQLDWDTQGLAAEQLPERLAYTLTDSAPSRSFAVTGPQSHAELRSIEKLSDSPQVRLADIVMTWTSDGTCFGSTAFDLEPAGTPSCLLAMPAGAELISVNINGRVELPAQVADDRWRLMLGTGSLPQRIEVIFRGKFSSQAGLSATSLEAPRLYQLPVERTLWTVSSPAWAGSATIDQGERIEPLRYEMERLESMAALLESASTPLADLPVEDVSRWYLPWARRLLALRAAIDWQGELSHNLEASRQAATQVTLIDQEQTRLARRLATIDLVNRLASQREVVDGAGELVLASTGRWAGPAHAMIVGESSTLSLQYPVSQPGDMQRRAVQAIMAACVLLGLAWILTSTSLLIAAKGWPRVCLAIAGALWWLFLWPSWFGWVIMLASLLVGRVWPLAVKLRGA